jgi:hypothetical protein
MEMRNLVHGYQPAPKVVAQAPVSPSLSWMDYSSRSASPTPTDILDYHLTSTPNTPIIFPQRGPIFSAEFAEWALHYGYVIGELHLVELGFGPLY